MRLDYELRTGKRDEQLHAELPGVLHYVWQWFLELERGRTTGMGATAMGWEQIEAWARVRKRRLSKFELDCLLTLDQVRLEDIVKSQQK